MNNKIRISTILAMKKAGQRITSLTAYDYTLAGLLDDSGIDIILVGDSCGNVCAGYETTLPVTMDEMLYHLKSVRRGIKRALLVADMPFMSYQENLEQAIHNAGRLMKEGGAEAVKLEGGEPICPIVKRLVEIGIPVMGHLGFTPQSVHEFGGYGLRGADDKEATQIKNSALAIQEAGAFAIVLEKIPAKLAAEVTASLHIPTIGIGAGRNCDGQVLVTYDMLGLFDQVKYKFVRHYANLANEIRKATAEYCADVRAGRFPDDSESY